MSKKWTGLPNERCHPERIRSTMAIVYLGLGSNVGDRYQNLKQSLELISDRSDIMLLSSVYETEPVGFAAQPLFLNAVCCASTRLSPHELLTTIKAIEAKLGRRRSFPNAPRPIDIDILFYDNELINNPDLTIPHPRLAQRAFVLIPLVEINPDFIYPQTRKTVTELLSSIDNPQGVRKWAEAAEIMNIKGRHDVPDIS
jgi:2-amino-4-hydroxy-6-hydroxymethyldihydropteridine diphosphokinase